MTILGENAGNTNTTDQGNTANTGNAGNTGGQVGWLDSLPDDLKTNASLTKFKDVQSLAKSYVHAQGLIGKAGIVKPGEKATDEEWNHFFDSLGRPSLDKYAINAPQGKQVNEEIVGKFKTWAHESGLLPKQAQNIFEKYLQHEEESHKNALAMKESQTKEQLDALRKEWGQGWDKEIAAAKVAAREAGILEYLDQSGLGNDTTILKALAKYGKLFGEDKIRGEGGTQGQTPAEIESEISNILGNPKHPYFDNTHPGHKQAVDYVGSLFKKKAN